MSGVVNRERIAQMLAARLGGIGMAADLRNDDAAIAAVCRALGVPRRMVAAELSALRHKKCETVLARLGVCVGLSAAGAACALSSPAFRDRLRHLRAHHDVAVAQDRRRRDRNDLRAEIYGESVESMR